MDRPRDNSTVNESEDVFFDLEARRRLSQTILAWMDAAGTNRNRLAIRSGLSRNTINAILKGSRAASLERLARLAAALNTTAGALVDGQQPAGAKLPANAPEKGPRLTDRGSLATAHDSIAATQEALAIVLEVLRDNLQPLPAPATEQLRHASELLRPAS